MTLNKSRKILVAGVGTRGDLEPLLSIALELRARGLVVGFGCEPFFQKRPREHDLVCEHISGLESRVVEGCAEEFRNSPPRASSLYEDSTRWADRTLVRGQQLANLARRYDFFIFNDGLVTVWKRFRDGARFKLQSPPVVAMQVVILSDEGVKRLADGSDWQIVALAPWLYALQRPALPGPTWRISNFVPSVPDASTLGAPLLDFLSAGPPPLVVTMGSMFLPSASQFIDFLAETQRLTGCRMIVQSGWAGLRGHGNEDLLFVEDVPHALLFEKASCVIHHGGAGTTAATLRAGKPSICLPQAFDQGFWARALHRVGASPGHLTPDQLRPDRLATLIRESAAETIAKAALRQKQWLLENDGLGETCNLIEECLSDLVVARSGEG